ncbi:MAG: hypothetical protein FWG11_00975 [Promicromonosporaceae bacterium]|nr:hypothetical protein [Promicromonosporaceae bacterium]
MTRRCKSLTLSLAALLLAGGVAASAPAHAAGGSLFCSAHLRVTATATQTPGGNITLVAAGRSLNFGPVTSSQTRTNVGWGSGGNWSVSGSFANAQGVCRAP